MIEVSENRFDNFINSYPRELTTELCLIGEPPIRVYIDYFNGNRRAVAKIIYDEEKHYFIEEKLMDLGNGRFEFKGEIQLKQEDIEKFSSLFASEEMLCTMSLIDEKGSVLDEKKGKIEELPGGAFVFTEV